ncbi:MAG: O-antigen ligase family protein [Crocinitomicaceae bacterium]
MNAIKTIKSKNLRLVLLVSVAFLLPLSKLLVPFLILLIGVEWVFRKRWEKGFFDLTYLGFFALFFVYQLFSLTWSENWDYGGADIVAKLSLILFPLFLGTKDEDLDYMKIFEWFVYGTLVLLLINLGYGSWNYFQNKEPNAFFYSKLSPLFHVAYASMYCILAIPLIYYFYLHGYKFFRNIWIASAIVSIEAIHVVLLNSKASFIAMMVVFLVILVYFIQTKWFKQFIVPAVLVFVLSIGTLFSSEFLYVRFFGGFEIFKKKSEQTISNEFKEKKMEAEAEAPVVSSQVRVVAWSTAWEIIKLNPFGVGIGDRKDVFLEKVGNKGHKRFVDKGLNTHNQYLQVLLAIGIPGFLIFLLNLFYPIVDAFKGRDFILMAFMANVSINLLFESMLEVQAGIIFYAFFAILLVKQLKEEQFTFPKQ